MPAGDMRGMVLFADGRDRGIGLCLGVLGIRSWLSAACLLHLGVCENSVEDSDFFVRFCVGKVGRMAREELAVLRKWLKWVPLFLFTQTECPSDSFSFWTPLCDRRRWQDQITMTLGNRHMLVSRVLCDPHGGGGTGRVAMICGAMAARTRHLYMLTKFPVRRQSYGSSSCQNSEIC